MKSRSVDVPSGHTVFHVQKLLLQTEHCHGLPSFSSSGQSVHGTVGTESPIHAIIATAPNAPSVWVKGIDDTFTHIGFPIVHRGIPSTPEQYTVNSLMFAGINVFLSQNHVRRD